MEDWQPLSKAAKLAGTNRVTLGKWVKAGRVKCREERIKGSNLIQKLVSLKAVKAIVGSGLPKGRPRKGSA